MRSLNTASGRNRLNAHRWGTVVSFLGFNVFPRIVMSPFLVAVSYGTCGLSRRPHGFLHRSPSRSRSLHCRPFGESSSSKLSLPWSSCSMVSSVDLIKKWNGGVLPHLGRLQVRFYLHVRPSSKKNMRLYFPITAR